MKKAYVYSVFPSLYQSWKISAAGEPVGTIDQDRTTAIAGRLGHAAAHDPGRGQAHARAGARSAASRSASSRTSCSARCSPTSRCSRCCRRNERAFGTSTIRVDARLTLAGGREVRVEDLFAEDQPALQAAALVAAPLAYLMANDFERVSDREAERATSPPTRRSRARPCSGRGSSAPGPVRAGVDACRSSVLLRTYRGETRVRDDPGHHPGERARPATYSLLVADGRHAHGPRAARDAPALRAARTSTS